MHRTSRPLATLLAALALALLGLDSAAFAAPGYIASGSYRGDGTAARAITGLGFRPIVLIIKADGARPAICSTATLPAGESKVLVGTAAAVTGRILSLDADGFTVGSHNDANALGTDYTWTAFGEGDAIRVGSYTGVGLLGQTISGLGIDPSLVVVLGEAATRVWQRSTLMTAGTSLPFSSDAASTNRITELLADGFAVGTSSDVNALFGRYHYIAWADAAGSTATGRYWGDGLDNSAVTLGGFQPDLVWVKSGGNTAGAQRPAALGGDATLHFESLANFSNGIQALTATGIERGTSAAVNQGGQAFYWLAARGADHAELGLALSADDLTPDPGQRVLLTLSLTNAGPRTATGVEIALPEPAGLVFESVSIPGSAADPGGGPWALPALPAGLAVELQISARVLDGALGAIDLTASILEAALPDLHPADDTATLQLQVPAADLGLALSAWPTVLSEGDSLWLEFTLVNAGPQAAGGVVVQTALPAGIGYLSHTVDAGSYNASSKKWQLATLAAGASATLRLLATALPGSEGGLHTVSAAVTEAAPPDPTPADAGAAVDLIVTALEAFTFGALGDTWIDEDQPSTTHGSETELRVRTESGKRRWGLIGFDLAALPAGSRVAGASLLLSVRTADNSGEPVSLHRLTAPWQESTARWSTVAAAVDGQVWSSFLPLQPHQYAIDVGALVADWVAGELPSHGFALKAGSTEVESRYYTKEESNVGRRPQLIVTTAGLADLGVTLAVDDAAPRAGQRLHFTATVTNAGPRAADGLSLTLALPAELAFVAALPELGSFAADTGEWVLGSLAVGASATLLVDADVGPAAAGVPLACNLAVASCAQGDPTTADNTAALALQVQAADLALTLGVDQPNPEPGALLSYELRVDNLGPDGAAAIVLRDSLGTGLALQSAVPSQGSFEAGSGLWEIGTLLPGDAATLLLSAQMLADGAFSHSAWRLSADQGDPVAANDSISLSVIPAAADLVLALSTDDPTGAEGAPLVLTVAVANLGPQTASGVEIGAALPAGLLYQGDAPSQGSYAAGSGLWSLGTLAAGESASLLLSATPAPGSAGTLVEMQALRQASLPNDPVAANDSSLVSIAVGGTDLALDLALDVASADPGDPVQARLVLRNLGPRAATGIAVQDSLPDGLAFVSADPEAGSYDAETGRWLPGALAAGDSLTLTLETLLGSGWGGESLLVQARIAAVDQLDPTPVDDAATASLRVSAADLALALSVDEIDLEVGGTCTAQLTLGNAGPNAAEGATVLIVVPDGLAVIGHSAGQGAFSAATGVWSLGALAEANAAALTLELEVQPAGAGQTLTLAAQAGAHTEDSEPANNAVAQAIAVGEAFLPHIAIAVGEQTGQSLLPGGAAASIFTLRLVNACPDAQTLQALTLHNTTSGAGSSEQLDADWAPLTLTAQLSAFDALAAEAEVPRATASFTGGSAVFGTLGLAMAAGDTLTLRLRGGASLTARDGDRLDLRLVEAADFGFAHPCSLSAVWPLDPAGDFPVDGLSAAQLQLSAPGSASLMTGAERALVMDLRVPPNGYQPDLLQKLNVVNWGSAVAGTDLLALELWRDDGDGLFSPALDAPLGELYSTVARWERYGLGESVPAEGLRLFVSADIAPLATEGSTVALGLPVDPADTALGLASANDGPIDRALPAAQTQVISADNRVTVSAPALPLREAAPGETQLPLLALQFNNSFAEARTLTRLALDLTGSGSGTQAEIVAALERVALWEDADGNGLPDATDPLALASPSGAAANLSGFVWTLPAESEGRLLVTGDLSLELAADGDRLGAQVGAAGDLGFADATVAAALFPLGGEGALVVDGLVLAQLANQGAPVATVGPGEGPVLGLDFRLPANGYAPDDLLHLTVVNAGGTAGEEELGNLTLWADGGDGLWGAGSGDDLALGALAWLGDSWQSAFGAIPVPTSGLRLFVSFTVSPALADSATLRLGVPVDGLVMASANDGPRDLPLVNPETQLLSTATLLSSLSLAPAGSIVGQPIAVTMTLRNNSAERLAGVTPTLLTAFGTGAAQLLSGPTPASLALEPGETGLIGWSYGALAAGDLSLAGGASGLGDLSGLTHLSLPSRSGTHQIWVEADSLSLHATVSLPFVVNRGSTDVLPLHLTLSNQGGEQASDVSLQQLHLRLRAPDGSGIVPATLLSGLRVKEGAQVYLARDADAMETSGDQLALSFTQAVRIRPGDPVTLDLAIDIAAGTLVPEFSLRLESGLAIGAVDATSGAPVQVVLEGGSFPVVAGPARVSAPAATLLVSAAADTLRAAGQGQPSVLLQTLQLENPGDVGITADLRLLSMALAGADSAGTASLPLGERLVGLRLVDESGGVHAERSLAPADSGPLTLSCSPLVSVAAGTPRTLRLFGDLAPAAPLGVFRLRLEPAATLQVSDAISGAAVPASYAEPLLLGAPLRIESAGDRVYARSLPVAPDSASVGAQDLALLSLRLRHPGASNTAGLRVAGLTLRFLDAQRDSLAPGQIADRLRAAWNGTPLMALNGLPAAGGSLWLPLGDRLLAPGETAALDIALDLEAGAPPGYFEVAVGAADCPVVDANTGEPALLTPEAGEALPLSSGLVWLEEAPRELVLGLTSRLPALLAADGQEVPCALLTLANPAAAGAGAVTLAGFRFGAEERGGAAIAIGAAATRLRLYREGLLWAESAALTADSLGAWIAPAAAAAVEPGAPLQLELRALLSPDFTGSSLRLSLAAADVRLVQPANPLLAVTLRPASGQEFPLRTAAGTLSPRSLAESYSNFPNPFPAGRSETTIAYYLERPARVSLKLWTGHGELVRTLLDGEARAAGLQQADRWDGKNGRGNLVQSGVYLAELTVRYEGGGEERLLRKLAVLR